MSNSVYKINKGINNPIVFKGLKGQYIVYLAVSLLGLLILFAILYIAGVNMLFSVMSILVLGAALFVVIFRLSDKYGQHGLSKKIAGRSNPDYLISRSRKLFIHLKP
jgi:hypothetical protein